MLNIINEDPVSEEHVAWFTSGTGDTIKLHEVVKAFYRHPEVPEHAVVSVLEERFHGEKRRSAPEAAAWILLEAAQQAVCNDRDIVKVSGDQQMKNAQAAITEGSEKSRTCEMCQHWTRRKAIGGSGFGRCPKNAPPIQKHNKMPATGGFNTTSRLHSCEDWLRKTT